MYLIRQLASKYKLTRSSLLHYDAIGLLSPSARSEAGYRLYSEEDEKKLQGILLFRSMGISLENIGLMLKYDDSSLANAMMIRLNELNKEIEELKQRQKNIIELFKKLNVFEKFLIKENKNQLTRILMKGINPLEWHEQFEKISPDLHKEFLEILDLVPDNIKKAMQKYLNSLPEAKRSRLKKIISKH
jgi:MerR family transcriptional regulator, thiopeptide resistance regulator